MGVSVRLRKSCGQLHVVERGDVLFQLHITIPAGKERVSYTTYDHQAYVSFLGRIMKEKNIVEQQQEDDFSFDAKFDDDEKFAVVVGSKNNNKNPSSSTNPGQRDVLAVKGARSVVVPDKNEEEPSSVAADQYIDELQALNTALCFLCSINADSAEVERFLKIHPEALLFEGVCLLPEDSAKYILEQHMKRCKCHGGCNKNRQRVMELVQYDFGVYHDQKQFRTNTDAKRWAPYFDTLVNLEGEIRVLRRDELLLRNTLVETSMEAHQYQQELDAFHHKYDKYDQNQHQATTNTINNRLALLACTRNSHHNKIHNDDMSNRRTVLEYQVGVAAVNLKSVEQEHARLLEKIREGRRSQFVILKKAFEGILRHDICSIGYVAPSPEQQLPDDSEP